MADFATELLLNALRKGRQGVLAGESQFQAGAQQDLLNLLARQGQTATQAPGLQTALARQLSQRGQEQALDTSRFERGLSAAEQAASLEESFGIAQTGQALGELEVQGRRAEQELTEVITRMKRRRADNASLDTVGRILGMTLGLAL